MKKTLLILFLITSSSLFAQSFSTGTQTLTSGLTANINIDNDIILPNHGRMLVFSSFRVWRCGIVALQYCGVVALQSDGIVGSLRSSHRSSHRSGVALRFGSMRVDVASIRLTSISCIVPIPATIVPIPVNESFLFRFGG